MFLIKLLIIQLKLFLTSVGSEMDKPNFNKLGTNAKSKDGSRKSS